MYTNSNRTSKMENWVKKKGEGDLIYILNILNIFKLF